ncbi:hypothetical protein OZX73_02630 [Bifidobacterium sp. ESL0775]|uniref:hypothetical protein n=1 Tax=Bifidobacterium sp. ESL0775 TaxID=2983230 RepID=UPI0023F8E83B|nr:hypothetical protein [Bifidobacterium sp. ESL0775]WEV69789.1 hypothetical protein OZX73_02630 [Bifidobacterium sp. ESL0775]
MTHKLDGEPRSDSIMKFLMVMVIVLSAKVDAMVADVICLALASWSMWEHHVTSRV